MNGASIKSGDTFASGTVSGPGATQLGSLIEMTSNGAQAMAFDDGTERTLLEDGIVIEISGSIPTPGGPVSVGSVRAEILPSR